jgi:hypothetical protein
MSQQDFKLKIQKMRRPDAVLSQSDKGVSNFETLLSGAMMARNVGRQRLRAGHFMRLERINER